MGQRGCRRKCRVMARAAGDAAPENSGLSSYRLLGLDHATQQLSFGAMQQDCHVPWFQV
jgi:hypothetical protein